MTSTSAQNDNTNLDDGLARLRASKKIYAHRQGAEGRLAGKTWAREDAKYGDLKKIADIANVDGLGFDARRLAETLSEMNYSPEYCFGVESAIAEEFAIGFIEGAAEVFEQV